MQVVICSRLINCSVKDLYMRRAQVYLISYLRKIKTLEMAGDLGHLRLQLLSCFKEVCF